MSNPSQKGAEGEHAHLYLYFSPTCLWCHMVRSTLDRLGVKAEMLNIRKDEEARKQLIEGGGRATVPCLRIDDQDGRRTWMYESQDIIAYLEQRFS